MPCCAAWPPNPRCGRSARPGLDYHRNYSPREVQLRVFEQQLTIAAEANMPVFLHQRDAHADFLALLKSFRDALPAAVVHCFTDTREALFHYLDLDCHIGITGWLCDERRGLHLREFVREIPAGRLMIETDSPYLLPRTVRPKPSHRRNEPMYLKHICEELARDRGEDVETTAAAHHRYRRRLLQPAARRGPWGRSSVKQLLNAAPSPATTHSPGWSVPKSTSPTRTRTSRSVGRPTAAVMRRTWRLRPSRIVSSSQAVGMCLRKRTGGSRGHSQPGAARSSSTCAGRVHAVLELHAPGEPVAAPRPSACPRPAPGRSWAACGADR